MHEHKKKKKRRNRVPALWLQRQCFLLSLFFSSIFLSSVFCAFPCFSTPLLLVRYHVSPSYGSRTMSNAACYAIHWITGWPTGREGSLAQRGVHHWPAPPGRVFQPDVSSFGPATSRWPLFVFVCSCLETKCLRVNSWHFLPTLRCTEK